MSEMISDYLKRLKEALSGVDDAVAQDALYDAEEYLRTSLEQFRSEKPEVAEEEIMNDIIDKYGSPGEIAGAYRELEARLTPVFAERPRSGKSSPISRFFGVLLDPRAYGSFFFLIFSLVTGIIYFTWATTGLSLSAGFIVLIFGIPFFGLFLLSIQGLAMVEGRIVEGMVGVRMPRRPIFYRRDMKAWEKFKYLAGSGSTWKAILYMIVKLPVGIISFTIVITMISISLSGILYPFWWLFSGFHTMHVGVSVVYISPWILPLFAAVGILWLILTLHLSKALGKVSGSLARAMLVNKM